MAVRRLDPVGCIISLAGIVAVRRGLQEGRAVLANGAVSASFSHNRRI